MTRNFGRHARAAAIALAVGAGASVLFGGVALAGGHHGGGFDFDEGGDGGDAFVTCTAPVQTITPVTQAGPLQAAQCVGVGGDGAPGEFEID